MWVAMVVIISLIFAVDIIRLVRTVTGRRRWASTKKERFIQVFDLVWLTIFTYFTVSMFVSGEKLIGTLCVLSLIVAVADMTFVNRYLNRSEQHEQNS